MLVDLFTWLTNTLAASPGWSLLAAGVWGVLSIVLSPCHLASIPLIIGFIDDQGRISTRRAFGLSLSFGLGILITIALVGMVTSWMGRLLGDLGPWGNYLVAVIMLLVGLHLLEVITIPFVRSGGQLQFQKKGLGAAWLLGLVFGIALGPCTFAYMAPVLAMAFQLAASHILIAIGLVVAYALGHIAVIIVAGTSTELVQRFLNWNEKSRGTFFLKKICGVLVLLGGLYMIYTAIH